MNIIKTLRRQTAVLSILVCVAVSSTQAATIGYMVDADAILDQPFDQFWVERLENQGHNVEVFGDMEFPDAVPDAELFIISNDIGSGNVVPEFWEEPRPIIVSEQALFDELAISTAGAEEMESVIVIEDANHPLAAGLSGEVEIYQDIQQITRIGDDWADGLDVVATLFDVPVLAVLEQGAVDFNGDDAAGQRIAIFVRDASDGELYTDEGLALLDASVNYALGLDEVGPTKLEAGDADQDLDFDQLDLVKVQIAAKYLSGAAATWGEGDWDGAPGGEQGSPPAGNGLFDQLDIVSALSGGKYLTGPYGAVQPNGVSNDDQTSLVYDAQTGELRVDAPAGKQLTSMNVTSSGNLFVGDKPAILDGAFDNFAAGNIFKATFGGSFGSISFGQVLEAGIPQVTLLADLSVVGSLAGGGELGDVDLIYVPEPSSIGLLALAIVFVVRCRRRPT